MILAVEVLDPPYAGPGGEVRSSGALGSAPGFRAHPCIGSQESMKCLSLQTSQGVVFSEAGRYYTLTLGRAVRKRRASASEGRSEGDRVGR